MRLLLVVLILTLLPLQFSAAAAADCCGHFAVSQEPQTQHHQPIHLSVAQGTDAPDSDVLGFDLDCGVCHANCAAAVMEMVETTEDSPGIERGQHLEKLILPPWQEQPYRPQWSTPRGSGWNAVA